MKRPYLTEQQRKYMRIDCFHGQRLLANLAVKKFQRSFGRDLRIKKFINWISERLWS